MRMTRRSGMFDDYIIGHCPEGKQCQCLDAIEPWKCKNWGRSTLGCPAIIGRDPQYGGGGQKVNRGPK